VWATPAGSYTKWSLEGDSGSAVDITDGLRVDFTGGTGINTTVAAATPNTLTIALDNTGVTAGSYTYSSITVDAQGRLTAASSGAAPGTMSSFTLTGDSGTNQTILDGNTLDVAGGTNISTVVGATDTVTVNLDDSVTLAGQLTVSGNGQNAFVGQVTIPTTPSAGTDAASKNYVDTQLAGSGVLIFQGGYNASTNTPDLDVSPSSSIKKGWSYVVTADGSFFTEQVRVGDFLIANDDSPTALSDWTTVQSNIDLATLSSVGIGNVNAGEGIDVSYSNGTATVSGEDSTASNKGIVIVEAGTGISVAYSSGTATVTNSETNSSNTYATTISATGAVTHSLGTKDVIVQLYDTVTDLTVYARVVLVQKIG